MLQNALDLSISRDTLEAMQASDAETEDVPAWAAISLTAMEENGIVLEADTPLSRSDAAQALYQASYLAASAPGMMVFRMQQ